MPVKTLWYTRCPVPSASGIAIANGLLKKEFAPDGIEVRAITEADSATQEAHFTHGLGALFREGGNVPSLATRAAGTRSRLIGLTFVPEYQAIAVPPGSPICSLAELEGRRLLLPDHRSMRVDFFRSTALRIFTNAGLRLDRHELIDVYRPLAKMGEPSFDGYDWELDALAKGKGDAIAIKGAWGAEAVSQGRVRPIWSIDPDGPRVPQINNGTPRTITVSEDLLVNCPDLVTRYLETLHRAAEWGKANPDAVKSIVSSEIGATVESVGVAYGAEIARFLSPSLAPELLALLADQKNFLLRNGFIANDFDIDAWVAAEPLARMTLQKA